MNEIVINPCPFCGSKKVDIIYQGKPFDYMVECRRCAAIGPLGKTERKAINRWNKRKEVTNER